MSVNYKQEESKTASLFAVAFITTASALLVALAFAERSDVITKSTLARAFLSTLGIEATVALASYRLKSIAAGLAATGVFVYLSPGLNAQLQVTLITLFGITGIFTTAKKIISNKEHVQSILIAAGINLLGIFALTSKTSYSLLMESKIASGNIYIDQYFHASIAAMIKNYNAITTGTNGLTEFAYHHLSHKLVALVSETSGSSILSSYGVVHCGLLLPGIAILIYLTAAKIYRKNENQINLALYLSIWILLIALPYLLGRVVGLSLCLNTSSSVLSFIFFFAAVNYGIDYIDRDKSSIPISAFCTIGSLLFLSTIAKGPTGLMLYAGTIGYILTSTKINKGKKWDRNTTKRLLGVIACTIIFYWAFKLVSEGNLTESTSTGLMFLPYIRAYSFWGGNISSALGSIRLGTTPGTIDILKSISSIILFFTLYPAVTWIALAYLKKSCKAICPMTRRFYIIILWWSLGSSMIIMSSINIYSAGNFFGITSIFLSIPVVCLAIDRFARQRQVGKIYQLSAIAVLTISASIGLNHYIIIGQTSKYQGEEQGLITRLKTIKNNPDKVVVDNYLLEINPEIAKPLVLGNDCRSLPLVFTGISEKSWTGLEQKMESCKFQAFGYRQ